MTELRITGPHLDYCRCGHIRGTHFAMASMVTRDENLLSRVAMGKYTCHGKNCRCSAFTLETRFAPRFKRWIGKR